MNVYHFKSKNNKLVDYFHLGGKKKHVKAIHHPLKLVPMMMSQYGYVREAYLRGGQVHASPDIYKEFLFK